MNPPTPEALVECLLTLPKDMLARIIVAAKRSIRNGDMNHPNVWREAIRLIQQQEAANEPKQ